MRGWNGNGARGGGSGLGARMGAEWSAVRVRGLNGGRGEGVG